MNTDSVTPTLTIKLELAKYDGEYEEGKEAVEIIETIETISFEEWLKRISIGG